VDDVGPTHRGDIDKHIAAFDDIAASLAKRSSNASTRPRLWPLTASVGRQGSWAGTSGRPTTSNSFEVR